MDAGMLGHVVHGGLALLLMPPPTQALPGDGSTHSLCCVGYSHMHIVQEVEEVAMPLEPATITFDELSAVVSTVLECWDVVRCLTACATTSL